MDFRRGLLSLCLCLSLIAAGWAPGPASAGEQPMQADCPAMHDAPMGADDMRPTPTSHRDRGCCHGGACPCVGVHAAAVAQAPSAPGVRVASTSILRSVPEPYVSPTLTPPVRPPIG